MEAIRIKTDRLLLRPFARADARDVFAYASNPNVSRYVPWETHRTVADSEAFIEMVLNRGPNEHTWAILRDGQKPVIGVIEFGLASEGVAQIDYALAEPFWGRGLMTEAARAVLAWGLERYPSICRVVSRAMTENLASQRVMEKCGMHLARTTMDWWEKFGREVEQREFVLVRGGAVGA